MTYPQSKGENLDGFNQQYERQMHKLSENLEKWYGKSNAALQAIAVRDYYSSFDNCEILDVGNGGLSPDEQLGTELAGRIRRFVGLDKSSEMIARKGTHEKIICDGAAIPLADNAVDYCLLNNVIHHVGVWRNDDSQPAARLIKECMRVSRRGVIVVEMTIPTWARRIESAIVSVTGGMATFVFDARTLRRIFNDAGVATVKKYSSYRLPDLVGAWSWFRPVISLPINVPAQLIPYTYVFCELSK